MRFIIDLYSIEYETGWKSLDIVMFKPQKKVKEINPIEWKSILKSDLSLGVNLMKSDFHGVHQK